MSALLKQNSQCVPGQTTCEYLLDLKTFIPRATTAAQIEDPSVSKGFFVCGIKMTDLPDLSYERLHADSLIDMHVREPSNSKFLNTTPL